jgi:hypothetical protein
MARQMDIEATAGAYADEASSAAPPTCVPVNTPTPTWAHTIGAAEKRGEDEGYAAGVTP